MIAERDRTPEITVRCLFFAAYREAAGSEELKLNLPTGATVEHLVRVVRERLGGEKIPPRPVVAVNQEYASSDQVVTDGDEIAFIPPVAGG